MFQTIFKRKKNWPIIVGGVHRSGTSLVRRVLNAHPRIYCGPEIKFFRDWHGDYIGDPIAHARFLKSARAVLPEDELFAVMGKAFIEIHELAAAKAKKSRWADKNPENVLYLDLWGKLLGENWLFVQVVRNPLDTIASIAEADFKFAIPSELDARIEFYNQYSLAGLDFYKAHPNRSYKIIYEKLVTEPRQEVERLMTWLGETFTLAQLDFNSTKHQKGLEDPKIKKTKTIHNQGVGRWKEVFSKNEQRQILDGTGDTWKLLDEEEAYPLKLA